jgi:hypothetical protein
MTANAFTAAQKAKRAKMKLDLLAWGFIWLAFVAIWIVATSHIFSVRLINVFGALFDLWNAWRCQRDARKMWGVWMEFRQWTLDVKTAVEKGSEPPPAPGEIAK